MNTVCIYNAVIIITTKAVAFISFFIVFSCAARCLPGATRFLLLQRVLLCGTLSSRRYSVFVAAARCVALA
jgi:hypothetical protein